MTDATPFSLPLSHFLYLSHSCSIALSVFLYSCSGRNKGRRRQICTRRDLPNFWRWSHRAVREFKSKHFHIHPPSLDVAGQLLKSYRVDPRTRDDYQSCHLVDRWSYRFLYLVSPWIGSRSPNLPFLLLLVSLAIFLSTLTHIAPSRRPIIHSSIPFSTLTYLT